MPHTGNVAVHRARERHPELFDAARLRSLAAGQSALDARRSAAVAAREHARRLAAARREQQEDRRILLREMAADAEQARQSARAQLAGVRADPAYALMRTWEPRMDRDTVYDAVQWRTAGRLVPVSTATRRIRGRDRAVIDWTAALDREAQGLGMDVLELPAHFQRLRKQEQLAHRMAREAEEKQQEYREMRQLLRGA